MIIVQCVPKNAEFVWHIIRLTASLFHVLDFIVEEETKLFTIVFCLTEIVRIVKK